MRAKQIFFLVAALLLSGVAYIILGYFTIRPQFEQLIGWFALAFGCYVWLMRQNIPFKVLLGAALLCRLLFLFTWPSLSDDYFRFIWDGRLFALGENPFLHLPDYYISQPTHLPGLNPALFRQLNSPHYYSVYPPICQYIFGLSSWVFPANSGGAVVLIRLVLLAAEAGSLYLMYRLLLYYRQPVRDLGWYALNPLVIVELTGNLHFEALMIFFLLSSLYLLKHQKIAVAGAAFGLAVAVKMVPLLLLPFILARLGWKLFITFGLSLSLVVGASFIPFLSEELFRNIGHSLNLYFQKFEFNASIYYLLRELGFAVYGYNNIARFGPLLSGTTLGLIVYFAFKNRDSKNKLPEFFLIALSIYFFLATTVHPWYLTSLLAMAVFTRYRYVYVWSGMALLSYATYQTKSYHENLYLTALEYTLVFGWLIAEYTTLQSVKTFRFMLPER